MTVEIHPGGSMDVSAARQQIRHLADEFQWTAIMRLRVLAAFNALTETLYLRETTHDPVLKLCLRMVGQDTGSMIEFHVDVVAGAIQRRFPVAHWRLKWVSDELEIKSRADYDRIIMRLWSSDEGGHIAHQN